MQAEGVAIATDLAEVIGGAVALYLLFGLPLPIGGLVTGVVAFGLLALQERGHRPFERAVAGLFAVIVVGFVITLLRVAGRGRAAGRRPRAGLRRPGEPAAGDRHPRRHGDAARHLPALGADLPTRIHGTRPRSATGCSAPTAAACCWRWGWPGW